MICFDNDDMSTLRGFCLWVRIGLLVLSICVFFLGNLLSSVFTLAADDKTFCSIEDIISYIWMLR